jgi:hypothetical protein
VVAHTWSYCRQLPSRILTGAEFTSRILKVLLNSGERHNRDIVHVFPLVDAPLALAKSQLTRVFPNNS